MTTDGAREEIERLVMKVYLFLAITATMITVGWYVVLLLVHKVFN